MRIAVIGSGISGLGCAHTLRQDAHISLYEAEPRLGGHTNTVDVTLDGMTYPVDTGFLVLNERTYPNLIRLLAELDVPTALIEGDNLRHTTDFRRVYATATAGWLGYPDTRGLLGDDFAPLPMFG